MINLDAKVQRENAQGGRNREPAWRKAALPTLDFMFLISRTLRKQVFVNLSIHNTSGQYWLTNLPQCSTNQTMEKCKEPK